MACVAGRRMAPGRVALVLVLVCLGGCRKSQRHTPPPPDATPTAPEHPTGWTEEPGWSATRWIVAAANPLAAEAGAQMLREGGSAVDAAIAVQMVLGLVEPQSSGLGGGAFLLHWDGTTVTALDGRETAPAAATESLFLRDGAPKEFYAAVVGGRSVGVPGVLRMLEEAHRRFGKLPWNRLFQPAIDLAEKGFAISPRLAMLLAGEKYLSSDPPARSHFYKPDGSPKSAGTLLRNPDLAETLRELADRGADAFYEGEIASAIVAKVRENASNPGLLTTQDLAGYRPREREPLCFDYRRWRICGLPPPSSGTVAVGQMLGILEGTDVAAHPPSLTSSGTWTLDPIAVHLFSEAERLAFADRALYLADPDFIDVPTAGLLDPTYLAGRAALLSDRSMGVASPGTPPGTVAPLAPFLGPDVPGTSHLVVIDPSGNAVSMTTTIEDGFGSRQMVRGFLLNNQLTDFSFSPTDDQGRPVANRVQPGKRPRSSMSPLLVFDRTDASLRLALGSPGGGAIIHYVAKVLIATLDWNLDVQTAIALPNFGSRNGPTELESGRVNDALADALRARGHEVVFLEENSGLHAVERTSSGWFAGADPRREGVAVGD